MTKNKKLNSYSVTIIRDTKRVEYKHEIEHVLAENENYAVLDNYCFRSLRKTGTDRELDRPIIFTMDYGVKSHDGVYYHYYSFKTHRASSIKQEIENYLTKKFGYIFNVDLSIIK